MRLKHFYRMCRWFPILLVACTMLSLTPCLHSQQEGLPAPPRLSVARIVSEMQLHDRMRRQSLLRYESTRHYEVAFHGFFHSLTARMAVRVSYDAASGKSFRILSQSGSALLLKEVLMRAVQSEEEASHDPAGTALSPRNYRFRFLGDGDVDGRPAYILHVHPLRPGKYLYEGKIWVDAADFAVARIAAEPAKSPSFWITHTKIDEQYQRVEGFWLPHSNRSETKVRFTGTAMLTIDYGTYAIEARPQTSRLR